MTTYDARTLNRLVAEAKANAAEVAMRAPHTTDISGVTTARILAEALAMIARLLEERK